MGLYKNFKFIAYDTAEFMTLWKHIRTDTVRWVPLYKERRDGLEKAFGPILKLLDSK